MKRKFGESASIEGVIALPAIILISMLVLAAGIGISSSRFLEDSMSFDDSSSKKALTIAEAGAEDAFLRIVKNKICNEGGAPDCSSYILNLMGGTANVSVVGGSNKVITAEGVFGNKKRKVRVDVSFDGNNEATQTNWQEITI